MDLDSEVAKIKQRLDVMEAALKAKNGTVSTVPEFKGDALIEIGRSLNELANVAQVLTDAISHVQAGVTALEARLAAVEDHPALSIPPLESAPPAPAEPPAEPAPLP